jgi:hypothetical protein
MSFSICKTCQNKSCLKTKKPCKKVEKILRAEGVYSADWIRPEMPNNQKRKKWGRWREIPISSLNSKGRKDAGISEKWGSQE